jgi:hypothetical protein
MDSSFLRLIFLLCIIWLGYIFTKSPVSCAPTERCNYQIHKRIHYLQYATCQYKKPSFYSVPKVKCRRWPKVVKIVFFRSQGWINLIFSWVFFFLAGERKNRFHLFLTGLLFSFEYSVEYYQKKNRFWGEFYQRLEERRFPLRAAWVVSTNLW